MFFSKVVAVLVLVAAVSAQQGGYGGYGGYGQQQAGGYGYQDEHYGPAEYSFGYAVKDEHTKDIKQQHETRHGDKTEGEYSLLEADGTTRTVKYVVDGKSGFVAQVIRSGHAVHAAPAPHKVIAVQPVVQKVLAVQPVVHHQVVAVQPAYGASSYVSGSTFNSGNRGGYGGNYGGNFAGNRGGYGGNYGGQASSYVTRSQGHSGYSTGVQQGHGGLDSSFVSGNTFGLGGGRGGYGGYRN